MFRQDFTCPALLKDFKNITYTGLSPSLTGLSMPFYLPFQSRWPAPRSLATTSRISVDVFSSGYLDVSVLRGCPIQIPTDQSLLATPRGFSQRATSFFAS